MAVPLGYAMLKISDIGRVKKGHMKTGIAFIACIYNCSFKRTYVRLKILIDRKESKVWEKVKMSKKKCQKYDKNRIAF